MKKVWIIKVPKTAWTNDGKSYEIPWIYGRGEASILEADVTDEWLREHGYRSETAAKSGLKAMPWRKNNPYPKYGSTIESRDVPEGNLHYKIYRCYEIVIVDSEGNEIGNSNYCYGSRADAEAMAIHELKIAESSC